MNAETELIDRTRAVVLELNGLIAQATGAGLRVELDVRDSHLVHGQPPTQFLELHISRVLL
jgi:hypothetical protein